MQEIKKDFNVPIYIVDELINYIELTAKGHCKCMKWENLKSLLRLATVNGRITREQANFLENTYCRE